MDRNKGPDSVEPELLAPREAGTGAGERGAIPDCLIGRNADEVLQKLDAGDPLGLETAARDLIHERALLVDVERLIARSMAQAAFAARLYRGWPPLANWTKQQVERALSALLEEDRELLLDGRSPPKEDEDCYTFLHGAHGIPRDHHVEATVVFNDLPDLVRHCYFDTFVLRKSIDECAAAGRGTRSEVVEHLRHALTALSRLRDPERPDHGGQK